MQGYRNIVTALAVLLVCLLLPEAAWALTCDGSGGVSGGQIYGTTGVCDVAWGLQNLFSRVFCDFVTVVNDVLGKIFCSIQYTMQATVGALFTLYIAIFGAQLLMGTVQLTVKEVMVRFLKIAGVWAFITQTYWAIGLAFNFFVSMAIYGSVWVWDAIHDVAPATTDPYNIDLGSAGSIMPVFNFFDKAVYDAVIGPFTQANSAVIGFFFAALTAYPPAFLLAAHWLWLNFTIMLRAVITFLVSVSALAFLLALSPIFLSFMLFSSTYQFFENWLKYMMSYSIQVIVVFGCVAMWLASAYIFVGFFNELSGTVFSYNSMWKTGAPESDPVWTWGICPYDISQDPVLGPTAACTNPGFNPVGVKADRDQLITMDRIANEGDFIFYLIYRLITLIIIAFAFDALVRQAPYIAKSLAGPEYVPILGQGYGFSRYGIMNQTPEWARFGKQGSSIVKNIDQSLGISKTAKDAFSGLASNYSNRVSNLLSKR